MADNSRNNSQDSFLLVPAWDKVALADHGPKAVPVIPDMGHVDEDYGRVQAYKRPGLFSRFTSG